MTENVPNAEKLIRLMSAWGSVPAHKFYNAYPFFKADRERIIAEYKIEGPHTVLEATALLFAEYAEALVAQAGEAGTAETTKIGSVHEHAVNEVDAPKAYAPKGD